MGYLASVRRVMYDCEMVNHKIAITINMIGIIMMESIGSCTMTHMMTTAHAVLAHTRR